MKVSRIAILVVLTFSIALSVGMGLYISGTNINKDNMNIQGITVETGEVETSAKSHVELNNKEQPPVINSIGYTTKITKKNIYIKGESFEKLETMKVTEDIIGMNKSSFEEYAKKIGYTLEEFTGEKIVISQKINQWPSGLYVLKAVFDTLVLYKVDAAGNLEQIDRTNVILDQASENEKAGLVKGRVYNSIEEAEGTLADYSS
ncbi:MAG: hypothetical protein RR515_05915 [Clostridium sp.]